MSSFKQSVGSNYCGRLIADPNWKIAIVASHFNSLIVDRLIDGAISALERSGCTRQQITLVEVPGAFEILYATKKLLDYSAYDGILCLGAVIRGETPHFDMVANNVCSGIAQLNLMGKVPVIMGLLTTDTVEQALNRAGVKAGNNGDSAAQSLLEMVSLGPQFK